MFFIPKTKSNYTCISEINIHTLILCPFISFTTVMIRNMLIHSPFPSCIFLIFEETFGNESKNLHNIRIEHNIIDMNNLLDPVNKSI